MPTAVPVLSYTRKPVRGPASPPKRFESGEWAPCRPHCASRSATACVAGADGVDLHVDVHDAGEVWKHRLLGTLHTFGLVSTNGQKGPEPLHWRMDGAH